MDLVGAYELDAGSERRRSFIRCNMISTLDGAVTINGRSEMIGGPADHRVFQVLRSLADVILVGAGTVRAEGYGPARLSEDFQRQRKQRGQASVPPIAVVTSSGNLDWSAPFFTEAEARPIVFMSAEHEGGARERGGEVADVVEVGGTSVDVSVVVEHLHREGFQSVLLEGGPGLNAEVVHADLLDEVCLTLAPRLVAGNGPRVLAGPELQSPLNLEVVHLLEEDGFLFYRLAVRSSSGDRRGN